MKKRIAIILLSTCHLYAAGGPPMLTDGTGTPDDGTWEVNIASKGEINNIDSHYEVPSIDINYGYGNNIQLKAETAFVLFKDNNEAKKSGLGNAKIGVKWRFYESEVNDISISTYPQYTFLPIKENLLKGLASVEEALFIPIEVTKKIDNFSFTVEVGYCVLKNESNLINNGFLMGYEALPNLELFAEVYRIAQTNRENETIFANGGLQYKIASKASVLFSSGKELTSNNSQIKLFFIGLQLLF